MPVLFIVACRMLEDELAHLLCTDREIRELILVDGIALQLQKRQNRPGSILSRTSGLHSDLEQLKAAVYENIRNLAELAKSRLAAARPGSAHPEARRNGSFRGLGELLR